MIDLLPVLFGGGGAKSTARDGRGAPQPLEILDREPIVIDIDLPGSLTSLFTAPVDPEPGQQASAVLKLPVRGNVILGLGLVALAAFLAAR